MYRVCYYESKTFFKSGLLDEGAMTAVQLFLQWDKSVLESGYEGRVV